MIASLDPIHRARRKDAGPFAAATGIGWICLRLCR